MVGEDSRERNSLLRNQKLVNKLIEGFRERPDVVVAEPLPEEIATLLVKLSKKQL
jgi:hypothetical protein